MVGIELAAGRSRRTDGCARVSDTSTLWRRSVNQQIRLSLEEHTWPYAVCVAPGADVVVDDEEDFTVDDVSELDEPPVDVVELLPLPVQMA